MYQLSAFQARLAVWFSVLGSNKPRILSKFPMFQLLTHFIQRSRLKQTVLIFMVTQNSYCYSDTFNLLFLVLNWIQVGNDESKHLTNLLLQLVLLSLSFASSDSFWFFWNLLLLFLNLTTRRLLLFFDYEKTPPLPLSYSCLGKKPKSDCITMSMYEFNSSLGRFSYGAYKWAAK